VYVVVVYGYGCRRFVVLLVHNTLSLTQTVPVPGRATASAGKAKMMDDDDDDGTCKLVLVQLALPCPALPRLTRRPGLLQLCCTVPMAGSLLSTASPASIYGYGYGATLNTRPRPALFTLLVMVSRRTTRLQHQQNDSTQSLPLRQHLLVSAISHQATPRK